MYKPKQLAPNKILGRFPVIPSIVEQIKNPVESSILLTSDTEVKLESPSEKQLSFYRSFMLDRKNQLNFSIPVLFEIAQTPVKYDNEDILKLEVGSFWALSLVAGHSLGLDVEIDENGTEKYYVYFILDNPKYLYYEVSKEDVLDIIPKYTEEDEFLKNVEKMEMELAKEMSQSSLSATGRMPEIKLTNPASKIYTM